MSLTGAVDPRASPAPDLVERDLTAEAPDRLWVADVTRNPCGEGVLWLAAVRDVFSNRIVGWKTSDRCNTELALREDFFSTLEIELVYRTSWRTREQAENALFAHIDGWYNRERIQARLGWLSPDEYERTWHTSAAHPEPAPAR